jgi:hypothetical protein
MMTTEKTMTFEEAVEVVKEYTGCGNLLLDGLEQIQEEMQEEDDFLPQRVKAAFRFICAQMRPLFV